MCLQARRGEAVVELMRPVREEAQRLMGDKAYLESVYKEGADGPVSGGEDPAEKV